jgi:hypothetical protein
MLPIDIQAIILCDDVRREDNGKILVIGMYVGDVLIRQFPTALRLTWLLMGKITSTENPAVEFKVDFNRDASSPRSMAATVSLVQSQDPSTMLVISGIPIEAQEPTSVVLSVKDGTEWKELARKNLVLQEPL